MVHSAADFHVAASSPIFRELAKQGITLSSYLSLTQWAELHLAISECDTADLSSLIRTALHSRTTLPLRREISGVMGTTRLVTGCYSRIVNYVLTVSFNSQYYHIPSNISTIVDLLEAKNISWATYQENMPRTAWLEDYPQPNYVYVLNVALHYTQTPT